MYLYYPKEDQLMGCIFLKAILRKTLNEGFVPGSIIYLGVDWYHGTDAVKKLFFSSFDWNRQLSTHLG
jgi:hypothetical protein